MQRRAIIADRTHYERDPAGHLESLKEVSLRITQIAATVSTVDPQFRHYLDRCSYDKALAWLEESHTRTT
ncbi:MAG: hypothetical protein ABI443_06970 [Chthoniobacterales bacterium]